MASIRAGNSPTIERVLARKYNNTHKMVVHCVEFWNKDNNSFWEYIYGPCVYPFHPTICLDEINGYVASKDAAIQMKAYQVRHPEMSWRISRYALPQYQADKIVSALVWKDREATRFKDGKDGSPPTYTPLPWADEPWFKDYHDALNHFAHVSQERDGMIAFTENNEKGIADLQKRMAPGRYLKTYFDHTCGALPYFDTGVRNVHGTKVMVDPIGYYARIFTTTYGDTCELKFATTSEEMVEVYEKGPESCMRFGPSDGNYAGDVHPVSVYAAGDLQLAYLLQKDGEITARALVWPERLKVGRLYGDYTTLLSKLLELGYEKPKDFSAIVGARMLKIPYRSCHILPFLDADDCYYHESEDGKFWIMGKDPSSKFSRRNPYTNGLSDGDEAGEEEEYEYNCDNCGDGCNDYRIVQVPSNMRVPEGSLEEQTWCFYCSGDCWREFGSNDFMASSVPHVELATRAPRWIAVQNLEDYFECAVNGGWYHNDDRAGEFEDTGESVSNDAVSDSGLIYVEEGCAYYRPENIPASGADEPKVPQAPKTPTANQVWQVAPWEGTMYNWKVVKYDPFDFYGDGGYHSYAEAQAVCDRINATEAQQVAA